MEFLVCRLLERLLGWQASDNTLQGDCSPYKVRGSAVSLLTKQSVYGFKLFKSLKFDKSRLITPSLRKKPEIKATSI